MSSKAQLQNDEDPSGTNPYRGGYWYRVWSNGFCEQGGITRDYWGMNATAGIKLPIPYETQSNGKSYYTITFVGELINNTHGGEPMYINKTAGGFTPLLAKDYAIVTAIRIDWQTKGFISDGAYWCVTHGYMYDHTHNYWINSEGDILPA